MPDFGDNSPRENYGAVDPLAPSVANGQISPEQWAEYEKKRKRDAILGIIATIAGTSALGGLGQALNGTGIIGGATMPYADTVAWETPGIGATAAGTTAAGTIAGGTTAAGTTAGTTAAGKLFAGMSGTDIAALIASLTGTIGGALTKPPNTAPTTNTLDPSLRGLIDLQKGRLQQQQPLYESILKLANGLLPTSVQSTGPLPPMPGGPNG